MLLTLLLIVAQTPPAHGLAPDRLLSQCRRDTWGTRDGLPLLGITALAQTGDGYIWVGTGDGLFRFDGSMFDRFDTTNTPGLTSAAISALAADSQGRLWVGTVRGGFGILQYGRFHQLRPTEDGWNITLSFVLRPDGGMWICGNLLKQIFYAPPSAPGAIPIIVSRPSGEDENLGVHPNPDGSLIIATSNSGLYESSAKHVVSTSLLQSKMPTPLIRSFLDGTDGVMWYGTDHDGLVRMQNGSSTVFTVRDGLSSNTIQCLCRDRFGRLWIGTANGISYYDGKHFFRYTRADGLPSPDVHALLVDAEGNLWVGDGTQLVRFADTDLVPFALTAGASVVRMHGAYPSADGGLWCATNEGLWRMHRNVVSPLEQQATWPHSEVRGVFGGDGDTIWTWRSPDCLVLDRLDNTELVAQKPTHLQHLKITVPHNWARPFAVIHGVVHVLDDTDWYEVKPGKPIVTHPADFGFVFNAERAPDDSLWVGSVNGLFHLANHKIEHITATPAETKIIGMDVTDPHDILFVTETLFGRWHSGSIRLFGQTEGFPKCHPYQVIRDLQGNIWIGADNGIYRITAGELDRYETNKTQPLDVRAYQGSDGIESAPANMISGRRASDGFLWFVGTSGATLIDSLARESLSAAPTVLIQEATVDHTALKPGHTVSVAPGAGGLTVRFAALAYRATEKVSYRYRLTGFDTDWVVSNTRRVATYNSLPPGHYQFEVTARNRDGAWNPEIATAAFDLKPHTYETFWFKIVCSLLGLAIFAVIIVVRTASIHAQNLRLEAQVSARTTELSGANTELRVIRDELEAQNEALLVIQEELAIANEQLTTLATTDGLTGLRNRRVFEDRLLEEWDRRKRTGAPLSVILLDIDHFKRVNDSFGHAAGDHVLQSVAHELLQNTRPFDIVARYGGEEMVIIAPETDTQSALALAERLRAAIAGKAWPCGQITASFGVSTWEPSMSVPSNLTSDADAALYISKQAGRNRVSYTGRDSSCVITS